MKPIRSDKRTSSTSSTSRTSRTAAAAPPSPLVMQSWLSVARAYNLCAAVMTRRMAPLGLRMGEYEVLLNLLRAPGQTQQQLASRCFFAKSGVSMLISRMEHTGLVLRQADAQDARAWRLSLSSKGQALAERARTVQHEVTVAMTGPASDAELQTVCDAMNRASAALEAM